MALDSCVDASLAFGREGGVLGTRRAADKFGSENIRTFFTSRFYSLCVIRSRASLAPHAHSLEISSHPAFFSIPSVPFLRANP